MDTMADEARTTTVSARTSAVLRRTGESRGLRGLLLGGFMVLGAAMTVAAAAPSGLTTTVSVTADGSSPWSDTDTGAHNGKVRQGQTVAYQVNLKSADGSAVNGVTVTLAGTPSWVTDALTVTCPKGSSVTDSGCTFSKVTDTVTITAQVAVPKTAEVGSSFGITATAKSDNGTSDPTTATKTTVVKPGSTGSSSPTPTKTKSPTSHPTKTKSPSSGGSGSGGSGGGGGGTSGGGGTGSNGSGGGQTPPTLPPGSNSSAAPSLEVPSLSATSVTGLPTSQAPTPLVAIPPTTGTSPSASMTLSGDSRGTVNPVTRSIPLAAAGLALFVVCAWQLMRRYAIGPLAGAVGKFSGIVGRLGKLSRFTKSS